MNNALTIFLLLLTIVACNSRKEKSKILFVTTHVHQMKVEPNGAYLIELAIPFQKFAAAGYTIDIVSPKGGKIPIYHSGDNSSNVKTIINSTLFQSSTANSLKPLAIDPEE